MVQIGMAFSTYIRQFNHFSSVGLGLEECGVCVWVFCVEDQTWRSCGDGGEGGQEGKGGGDVGGWFKVDAHYDVDGGGGGV